MEIKVAQTDYTIQAEKSVQISMAITNAGPKDDKKVLYSATLGTISPTGKYTAPETKVAIVDEVRIKLAVDPDVDMVSAVDGSVVDVITINILPKPSVKEDVYVVKIEKRTFGSKGKYRQSFQVITNKGVGKKMPVVISDADVDLPAIIPEKTGGNHCHYLETETDDNGYINLKLKDFDDYRRVIQVEVVNSDWNNKIPLKGPKRLPKFIKGGGFWQNFRQATQAVPVSQSRDRIETTLFGMFIAGVVGVVSLVLFSFWVMIAFEALLAIGVILALWFVPVTRDYAGWIMACMRTNNNYCWFLSVFMFVLIVFHAAKYGPGESLLVGTLKEARPIVESVYTEEVQMGVNSFLHGEEMTDQELGAKRQYLKKYASKYQPLTLQEMIKAGKISSGLSRYEAGLAQNEYINNDSKYGLFASDQEVSELLKSYSPGQVIKKSEKIEKGKTWFLWQLAFAWLIFIVVHAPFAFCDEATRLLQELTDGARRLRDEVKTQAPKAEAAVAVASAAVESKSKVGLLSKIFASDMLAEFMIRILQKSTDFFAK